MIVIIGNHLGGNLVDLVNVFYLYQIISESTRITDEGSCLLI